MEKIKVKICCPECLEIQDADIEKTFPFYTYIHTCIKCNYLIMESEFNIVHKCKYCGIYTTEPDSKCYSNPNNNLLLQIFELIHSFFSKKPTPTKDFE